MLNVEHSTAQLQVSGLELKHNWINGGYQAINAGDPGLAGANLGAITENLFDDGDASKTPLRFIQSQTVLTTPQNTYIADGRTVVPVDTA